MGKKNQKIRLSEVRKFAQLQCTLSEIAAGCGFKWATFKKVMEREPIIMETIKEGYEQGKISLRRKQNRLASTSAQMAIHMGKQYLAQREDITIEHTGKDGGPIKTLDVGKLSAEERKKLRELVTNAGAGE